MLCFDRNTDISQADSLDRVELIMVLEEFFGDVIPKEIEEKIAKMRTVGELEELVAWIKSQSGPKKLEKKQ